MRPDIQQPVVVQHRSHQQDVEGQAITNAEDAVTHNLVGAGIRGGRLHLPRYTGLRIAGPTCS
jgi:hypothetical protein